MQSSGRSEILAEIRDRWDRWPPRPEDLDFDPHSADNTLDFDPHSADNTLFNVIETAEVDIQYLLTVIEQMERDARRKV